MSKQDEPLRRFEVVETKAVMRDLEPERERPNLGVSGELVEFALEFAFLGEIRRWFDRRRAAKARKRQARVNK